MSSVGDTFTKEFYDNVLKPEAIYKHSKSACLVGEVRVSRCQTRTDDSGKSQRSVWSKGRKNPQRIPDGQPEITKDWFERGNTGRQHLQIISEGYRACGHPLYSVGIEFSYNYKMYTEEKYILVKSVWSGRGIWIQVRIVRLLYTEHPRMNYQLYGAWSCCRI